MSRGDEEIALRESSLEGAGVFGEERVDSKAARSLHMIAPIIGEDSIGGGYAKAFEGDGPDPGIGFDRAHLEGKNESIHHPIDGGNPQNTFPVKGVRIRDDGRPDPGPDAREERERSWHRLEDIPPGGNPECIRKEGEPGGSLDPTKKFLRSDFAAVEGALLGAEEMRPETLGWHSCRCTDPSQRQAMIESDEDVSQIQQECAQTGSRIKCYGVGVTRRSNVAADGDATAPLLMKAPWAGTR